MQLRITLFVLLATITGSSGANNLSITNGYVNGSSITLDIGWNNCWNFSSNGGSHDAVWLFIKAKSSSGIWRHIDIDINKSSHLATSPLEIIPASDGKGIFVLSISEGISNIDPVSITVSVNANLSDIVELRVFGIEMVNVPQGSFFLGDGVSISSLAATNGEPILITSEEEISSSSISILNPNTQFAPNPLPAVISHSYPKGFKSFYVMKYELSQLQYVDFLNTLTYNQQQSRTALAPSSRKGTYAMINPNQPDSLYRNGIVIYEPGVSYSKPAVYAIDYNKNGYYFDNTDGIHRAANFINWADLSAYLDWAALRPITEMEYEKACRGANIIPVGGEFAWGTSKVTNANTPVNDGTVFERVANVPVPEGGLANHGTYIATEGWGLRGVLRTGFAAGPNTNRLQSGAAYYGIMEMSGNVWEQTIMIAAGGENFTGNYGDGQLTENGDADQPGWCNPTTASGVLVKGGGWGSTIGEVGSWRDLAVSDRFYSHLKPAQRRNTQGGRGGR
jgi:formylglycine-generating enzyme required for sulfatase activity